MKKVSKYQILLSEKVYFHSKSLFWLFMQALDESGYTCKIGCRMTSGHHGFLYLRYDSINQKQIVEKVYVVCTVR